MARTQSTMVELGTSAPPFALTDVVSGRTISRDELAGHDPHGLLVMFVCVHCPYVKHVEEELAALGRDYEGRIAIAAISSNDADAFPQDGPEGMKEQAQRLGWRFPYLFDESQEVARAYQAACTPDFFLFDAQMRLVYRGQLDGSRPNRDSMGANGAPSVTVTGEDLRRALDDVIAGRAPAADQRTSLGCNIKWRESVSA